jgi:hypothetical protein
VSFYDTQNQYHRQTIVIDRFDDGSQQLVKDKTVFHHPPCSMGAGCRACRHDQEHCEFDPKTGLCAGEMP